MSNRLTTIRKVLILIVIRITKMIKKKRKYLRLTTK